MKNNQFNGDATAITQEHLFVPLGLSAHRALPSDPDYTIPEVMKIYKVSKSRMQSMLVLGMLRFRLFDNIVLFRKVELEEDLSFAKLYYSFKTNEEKSAFLIGAKRAFTCLNFSSHYAYAKNRSWIDQIVYI